MIQASFVEEDRGKAIGAWSGFGGVATAIGPFLGGYLVAGPGWRWIFLINLPMALLVVLLAVRHVPESRDPHASPHLDVLGALLGALGLGGLTYGLIAAGSGWSAVSLLALAVGVLALVAFGVNERRSRSPMVPPEIFANPLFTAANIETFVVYAALSGLFFFLVVDLQVVAGFSPLAAGSALLPVTVIMLFLSSRRARWRPDRSPPADDAWAAGRRGRRTAVAADRAEARPISWMCCRRSPLRARPGIPGRPADDDRVGRGPRGARRCRFGHQQRRCARRRAAGRRAAAAARRAFQATTMSDLTRSPAVSAWLSWCARRCLWSVVCWRRSPSAIRPRPRSRPVLRRGASSARSMACHCSPAAGTN